MKTNKSYRDNLIIVAIEESSEIIQTLTKSLRFGLKSKHPKRKLNNQEEFLLEYYQLQSVVEKLQELGYIHKPSEKEIENIKENKITKVNFYFNNSEN